MPCLTRTIPADFIAALGLHNTVFLGHDTRGTKGVENGLQRQHRGVVLLREMTQGKLFAALLNELQQLGGALIVGEVPPGRFDPGA